MSRRLVKRACVALAGVAVIGMATAANADLVQKSSETFAYKYEMNVLPPAPDWGGGGTGTPSIVGGEVLDMEDYNYDGSSGFWYDNFSAATGYTIEARVKIISQTGWLNTMSLDNMPKDSHKSGPLSLGTSSMKWGYSTGAYTIDSSSNTDGFHVIRMARLAGTDTYNVWRDGTLLTPTPIAANGEYTSYYNWCYLGDTGGDLGGQVQVDYARYDNTGAYAPTPEPGSMVLLAYAIIGLLAYAWRKRK
jgi:hypothetical protein